MTHFLAYLVLGLGVHIGGTLIGGILYGIVGKGSITGFWKQWKLGQSIVIVVIILAIISTINQLAGVQ
jgi:F0F1-type ATP synthase membrane subunit c/vacuolar-type H+-ATPase subunit K